MSSGLGNAITTPAPYTISGDTNGSFSGNLFAGVDVSGFQSPQLFDRAFMLAKYNPGTSGGNLGKSTNADLDLTISAVPEPASLGLIGIGAVWLAGRRIRRKAAVER
jgi:hypothetical protein